RCPAHAATGQPRRQCRPALQRGRHPGPGQGPRRPAGARLMGALRKPAGKASQLTRAQISEMFSRLRELNPKPKTELEYSSPFELLVAVALSAQATDVGVNKATRRLFPVANTPEAILALGEDGLKQYINTIG